MTSYLLGQRVVLENAIHMITQFSGDTAVQLRNIATDELSWVNVNMIEPLPGGQL